LRNDYAFARGEPISLDDDRCPLLVNVFERQVKIVETAVRSCRNVMAFEEFFRERFRSLQLRGGSRGTEALESGRRKAIDDSFDQGYFRSDNGEVDETVPRQIQQALDIFGADIDVRHFIFKRRAGVARGDQYLSYAAGLGAFPGDCVLTPAAANN
jgi:hypothetical protein